MKELEKYISPFTEQLFPSFYREEGPLFISFVKAYYEWLEENDQLLYEGRRLPDYRDIDKTLDTFILQFKEKYLKNIQFTTASNKELFIKNALDFYRAKGTERAVELFFKLIHGIDASVYYPGDDLFKLSDNEFVDIKYVEITHHPENINFVGKTVTGTISGATGFAERLVRRKSSDTYIDVLFLSNVVGTFETDESITESTILIFPRVIGSLTNLNIVFPGTSFVVGEEVYISDSSFGVGGKAIISETSNTVGTVSFTLENGGFGYTTNSEILISERVFTGNSYSVTNTEYNLHNTTWKQFETVSMRLANVAFENSNGNFAVDNSVYVYDGGGNVVFEGTVLSVVQTTGSNSGTLIVNYNESSNSSSIDNTDIIYVTSNVFSAEITDVTDVSATGNVIATQTNATFNYTQNTASGNIANGSVIYQTNSGVEFANATVVRTYSNTVSGETFINVTGVTGAFRTDHLLKTRSTTNTYNIVEMSNVVFGIINLENTFVTGGNVYSETSDTYCTLQTIASGSSADFNILEIENEYSFTYNSDLIADYANVALDANAYGFPADPSGNLTSNTLQNLLTFVNTSIGSISEISLLNQGTGYGDDPIVVIYEPIVTPLQKRDYIITYDSETGSFAIDENITGETSNASGHITSIDTDAKTMMVTRLSISEDFQNGETITGVQSGTTANISSVNIRNSDPITGLNAIVTADAQSAQGAVVSLSLLSSGYGYIDGETVTLKSITDDTKTITATTSLGKHGIGEGYYKNRKGFLSSDKYLHDGDFYQEYSYQVLTSLPFERYKNTLVRVLHVAGTKPFGKYFSTNRVTNTINAISSSITSN